MSIEKSNDLCYASNSIYGAMKDLRNGELMSYSCGNMQLNSLQLADEFDKLWQEFNKLRVKLSFLENK